MLVGPDGATYQPSMFVHNGYALTLCKATWNGINQIRPGRRNLKDSRSPTNTTNRADRIAANMSTYVISLSSSFTIACTNRRNRGCPYAGSTLTAKIFDTSADITLTATLS
jgi:hypothetical protein